MHFIADFGAQLPVDGDHDSTSIFYNFHLDQAFETDVHSRVPTSSSPSSS